VPVGICRGSVDPAADEPTSRQLQPVVGGARALPQRITRVVARVTRTSAVPLGDLIGLPIFVDSRRDLRRLRGVAADQAISGPLEPSVTLA
jgi:hypothetical protein